MGMVAVGAYLKTCRKAEHLTQEDVARILGVSVRTISLWETGESEPGMGLLARLVDVIKARLEDVHRLILDECATAADGHRMAEEAARHMTDAELDEVISLFERLKDDPVALGRLFGYAERLAETRPADSSHSASGEDTSR